MVEQNGRTLKDLMAMGEPTIRGIISAESAAHPKIGGTQTPGVLPARIKSPEAAAPVPAVKTSAKRILGRGDVAHHRPTGKTVTIVRAMGEDEVEVVDARGAKWCAKRRNLSAKI